MKLQQAIEILETHNKWRKGAEIPQGNPNIIGMAIDTIVYYHKDEPISEQALIERGFIIGSCEYYNLEMNDNVNVARIISVSITYSHVCILGNSVKTKYNSGKINVVTLPSCKTLKQLDNLIDMFKN